MHTVYNIILIESFVTNILFFPKNNDNKVVELSSILYHSKNPQRLVSIKRCLISQEISFWVLVLHSIHD